MSKFNIGDKVRCVQAESSYWYEVGDVLTIKSKPEYDKYEGEYVYQVEEKDIYAYIGQDDFELVKEESNVKEFDLHKDKWFIRTPTKETFKLAQLWAIEQGFSWSKGASVNADGTLYTSPGEEALGGNHTKSGMLGHGYREFYEEEGHKEIKLTFKAVVDTVEYPEAEVIETPSQKELRILKEQIEQLTQQANKLETTLKGEV